MEYIIIYILYYNFFFFQKRLLSPTQCSYILLESGILKYPREILSYVVNLLINQQFSIEL